MRSLWRRRKWGIKAAASDTVEGPKESPTDGNSQIVLASIQSRPRSLDLEPHEKCHRKDMPPEKGRERVIRWAMCLTQRSWDPPQGRGELHDFRKMMLRSALPSTWGSGATTSIRFPIQSTRSVG